MGGVFPCVIDWHGSPGSGVVRHDAYGKQGTPQATADAIPLARSLDATPAARADNVPVTGAHSRCGHGSRTSPESERNARLALDFRLGPALLPLGSSLQRRGGARLEAPPILKAFARRSRAKEIHQCRVGTRSRFRRKHIIPAIDVRREMRFVVL